MSDPTIAVDAESSGAWPLALGQASVWRDVQSLTPEAIGRIVLAHAVPVGSDVTEASLERAFARLAARHEILRTRFDADPDGGRPLQRLVPASQVELPLTVEEVGDEAAPIDRIRRRGVRLWTSWPWFGVLVRRDGRADHVVVVMHHIGTDARGLQILAADLQQLLTDDELDDDRSIGARTLASVEMTEHGRRSGQRAVSRWRDALVEDLPTISDGPDVLEGTLRSPGLLAVVQQKAQDRGVPLSSIFLGAFVEALHRTQEPAPGLFRMMVSNRLGVDRADVVTSMNQWAPMVLGRGATSLAEVSRAAMLALRWGVYDVDELERVLADNGLDSRAMDYLPSFNLIQLQPSPHEPVRSTTAVTVERLPFDAGPRFYLRAICSDEVRLVLRVPGTDEDAARLEPTLRLIEEGLRTP